MFLHFVAIEVHLQVLLLCSRSAIWKSDVNWSLDKPKKMRAFLVGASGFEPEASCEKAMRNCGIFVHQQIIWVKNKPVPDPFLLYVEA
jgi:hypothetical protein